jgi:hypothetical protein
VSTEHARAVCGGAARCAACNARMILLEGAALRLAVRAALEHRTMVPDSDVIARVERSWRDSKPFRDKHREELAGCTTIRMTG